MKSAIITGITGQDGAYLAQHLIEQGIKVYGAIRRGGERTFWRLKYLGIENDLEIVELELSEFSQVFKLINSIKPDYFYNLGAMSFVGTSFEEPIYTQDVNFIGPLRILESIRLSSSNIKYYQASTSEMFGKVAEIPQSENTPFHPRSPYGISKLAAHWSVVNYREAYNIFASSGILFNHESPLRGQEFVTKKIVSSLHAIKQKKYDFFELGNLDAKRDWGFAKDYVKGMTDILDLDSADDYILATNETHTIREFCELAAHEFGYNLEWSGSGLDEVGIDAKTKQTIIKINPKFYRPAEVDLLIGDYTKINKLCGWKPRTSFHDLIKLMCKEEPIIQSIMG